MFGRVVRASGALIPRNTKQATSRLGQVRRSWTTRNARRSFSTTIPRRYSSPIIGIDLGTTNSCVAVLQEEKAVVLENDGKRTTPSIVALDKHGSRLVGFPAQRQMVVNPKNTFFATKRLIGRRFDEKETQEFVKQVPFAIVPSGNGDAWVADESGRKYSPSEIASSILIKLKEVAEKHLGQKVTRAVITVPAYFDNHQRQATQDAGKIAGLKVERIINEPTAAALAYGISRDEDKTVVVYDLGGGTFDVSILQLGSGVFEVKSTAGDTLLGGEDFNNAIMNYVLDSFNKKEGIDLSKDKVALQRVREASENAKHELSSRDKSRINLPYVGVDKSGTPKNLDIELTRTKYEELVKHLVNRTVEPCQKALSDAGLRVEDVTDVILVGGMTRMPMVRDLVKKFFKKEPFIGVNPDEAVAVGAALQGGIIANQGLIPGADQRELVLLDVTPLNLGIALHDGRMAVIIEAQTPIPCSKTHTFTTVKDFQTDLLTSVYQGNRPMAKDNRLLGEYTVTKIPMAPHGVPKIDVTFSVSANGIITSSSRDRASGVSQDLVINMKGGLSDADIERMRKEAEKFREADEARQAMIQIQHDIAKIQDGLNTDLPIPQDSKNKILADIKDIQHAIDSNKPKAEVEQLLKALQTFSGKVFADAYQSKSQNTQQEQQPPK